MYEREMLKPSSEISGRFAEVVKRRKWCFEQALKSCPTTP